MKHIAIIVAGGHSRRCGFDKLFAKQSDVLVIEKTLSVFQQSEKIDAIILVLSAFNFTKGTNLVKQFPKISKVLPGGVTRYNSVKTALDYAHARETEKARIIVHNGANPYLCISDLERGIEKAGESKNIIFGYFTPNSMKRVRGDRVIDFLDRSEIFETQTPQISDLATFKKAIRYYEKSLGNKDRRPKIREPRDEAELLHLIGELIFVHTCEPSNKKVTYASDFEVEPVSTFRPFSGKLNTNFRIGLGEDSHRFLSTFNPQKPIIIGGIPFSEAQKSFEANSDGDVVLHALCNALLSSIGDKTFDTFAADMCRSGLTDSQLYLERTQALIQEKYPEFSLINVIISLEGQYPKIAPRHDEMVTHLQKILGLKANQIGLTYTTGEGLSDFGRGLGLKCICQVFTQNPF